MGNNTQSTEESYWFNPLLPGTPDLEHVYNKHVGIWKKGLFIRNVNLGSDRSEYFLSWQRKGLWLRSKLSSWQITSPGKLVDTNLTWTGKGWTSFYIIALSLIQKKKSYCFNNKAWWCKILLTFTVIFIQYHKIVKKNIPSLILAKIKCTRTCTNCITSKRALDHLTCFIPKVKVYTICSVSNKQKYPLLH